MIKFSFSNGNKFEIRISKYETNSNDQKRKFKNEKLSPAGFRLIKNAYLSLVNFKYSDL